LGERRAYYVNDVLMFNELIKALCRGSSPLANPERWDCLLNAIEHRACLFICLHRYSPRTAT
jgi:hypothetical protein